MKILVPLSGTEGSREALEFARRIACEKNDELLLVTVGEAPDSALHADELRGELGEMLRGTAATVPGHAVRSRVELSGEPEQSIVRVAHEEAVDLIVMATHGRSMLARIARGSVSDAVLRTARVPVTLVPVPQTEVAAKDE